MRLWHCALIGLFAVGCSRAKKPSERSLMSADAFCRLLFEAPKRHLEAHCSAEDKTRAEYERLIAVASRPVSACVAALEPGVSAGRLKLHRAPAEACARAIEATAWKSSLRTRDLAAFADCKLLSTGTQAEAASCRTSLDCASELWCAGASFQADGVCRKRGAAGATCEAPLLFLFDETGAACAAGNACDFGPFRPAYALGYPPILSAALERELAKRRMVPAEPPPEAARSAALRNAQEFGMIGLLNTGGDLPDGGGGLGEGIGLGSIGTIGHGFGSGHGRLGGSRAPSLRTGATSVAGRLPPEVIQRIVRQKYGRFRLCYENGLRTNPRLQGRVSVRFVIERDGKVSNATGTGDLPDRGVTTCIANAFKGLSFPQPEGGIVTVVYPLTLIPAESADAGAPSPQEPAAGADAGAAASAAAETPIEVASKPVGAPFECRAAASRGQACVGTQQCDRGLLCRAGHCDAPGAAGEACESDVECKPDLYCGVAIDPNGARGVCKPLEPVGAACTDSSQCRGACGPDGKCVALCGAG